MSRTGLRGFTGLVVMMSVAVAGCGMPGRVANSTTSLPASSSTTSQPAATTSTAPTPTTTPPTTTPAAKANALLVVGDWGSGTMPEGAVAGAMQRYAESNQVDAILTTGDNFSIDDTAFAMQPFGWATSSGVPFWITWGNHDVESQQRIDAINETFDSPPYWTVHEWGGVDVLIIDSNQITSPEQAGFVLSTLQSSDRPTILALHHPPYSCTHVEETIDVINPLVAMLDDDVTLVLSGHDHSYQRFTEDGRTFVVSGGGGAELHPMSTCPTNQPDLDFGVAEHHFLALTQNGDLIRLQAIDVNGNVLDESTMTLP